MKRRYKALLWAGVLLLGACNAGGGREMVTVAQENSAVATALAKWTSEGLPSKGPPEVITLTKWSSGMGSQATYLVVFRFYRPRKPMVSDSPEGQVAVLARIRYGLFSDKSREPGPRVDLLDDGTSRP